MIRSAETRPISQPAQLQHREHAPPVPTHSASRKTVPKARKTSQAPAAGERLSLPLLYIQGQRKARQRELPSPSATASRQPDPTAHGSHRGSPQQLLAPENPLLKVLRILNKKSLSHGPGMPGTLCQGCFPPYPLAPEPTCEGFASQDPAERHGRARAPGPASSGTFPARQTLKPHSRGTGMCKTAKSHKISLIETRDTPY